jgi:hypothetical protein
MGETEKELSEGVSCDLRRCLRPAHPGCRRTLFTA